MQGGGDKEDDGKKTDVEGENTEDDGEETENDGEDSEDNGEDGLDRDRPMAAMGGSTVGENGNRDKKGVRKMAKERAGRRG